MYQFRRFSHTYKSLISQNLKIFVHFSSKNAIFVFSSIVTDFVISSVFCPKRTRRVLDDDDGDDRGQSQSSIFVHSTHISQWPITVQYLCTKHSHSHVPMANHGSVFMYKALTCPNGQSRFSIYVQST